MGRVVTDAEIAAWRPRVEGIAKRLGQKHAEFDDLVQEGLISVWVALANGVHPSDQMILNRMRMWIRTLRRQTYGRDSHIEDEDTQGILDDMALRDDNRDADGHDEDR